MTKTEIEEYLLKLEHKLIIESERKPIRLTRDWANSFPNQSAVYLFREEGEICYVGESGSIRGRMNDILLRSCKIASCGHLLDNPNYQ